MSDTLTHRGPDAAGTLIQDGVALACRRLSLVDLAGGAQADVQRGRQRHDGVQRRDLQPRRARALLLARATDSGRPATVEVILHLYETRGPSCWRDSTASSRSRSTPAQATLFLARDHAGSLLCTTRTPRGHFVFGSEIKSILEHPGVPRDVDLTGLDQVLTFPGLVSPRTMFRGIESVRNGHYLIVGDGVVTDRCYWLWTTPATTSRTGPTSSIPEHLRELLTPAVRLRMRADVEVGFYLSGGLDSSLIGALASQSGPPPTPSPSPSPTRPSTSPGISA